MDTRNHLITKLFYKCGAEGGSSTSTLDEEPGGAEAWKGVKERVFLADESPSTCYFGPSATWRPPPKHTADPIVAIFANQDWLLIGRASGMLQLYTLPGMLLAGEPAQTYKAVLT